MRPPLLGRLGPWSASVIVRLHQDPHKLTLSVTVSSYFAPRIAYADMGVKVVDENGNEMPVVCVDPEAKMLTTSYHDQTGSYEILVQEAQEIASVELTYQDAKAIYRVTEIRDLVDPDYDP